MPELALNSSRRIADTVSPPPQALEGKGEGKGQVHLEKKKATQLPRYALAGTP